MTPSTPKMSTVEESHRQVATTTIQQAFRQLASLPEKIHSRFFTSEKAMLIKDFSWEVPQDIELDVPYRRQTYQLAKGSEGFVSCLGASRFMLLSYLGKNFPDVRLRKHAFANATGENVTGLPESKAKRGGHLLVNREIAEKKRKEIDSLLNMGLPVAALVSYVNQRGRDPTNHWVVIKERKNGDYIYHEPGSKDPRGVFTVDDESGNLVSKGIESKNRRYELYKIVEYDTSTLPSNRSKKPANEGEEPRVANLHPTKEVTSKKL